MKSGHIGKNIKHFFVDLYFYSNSIFNLFCFYLFFTCVQTLWTLCMYQVGFLSVKVPYYSMYRVFTDN